MPRLARFIRFIPMALLAIGIAVAAGCASVRPAGPVPPAELRQQLATLPGQFAWRTDLDRYAYSRAEALETLLAAWPPDRAVPLLIDCLDDVTPSASTLAGHAVPVGVVCWQGLSQLVYYEPTDASGDVAQTWDGFIEPSASPGQLVAAKNAWKNAQSLHLLIMQ